MDTAMSEPETFKQLRRVIREAVRNDVGWELTKIDLSGKRDELFVTLFFKEESKPFTAHMLRDARRATVKTLKEAGERRYPVIFPRLADNQRVAVS